MKQNERPSFHPSSFLFPPESKILMTAFSRNIQIEMDWLDQSSFEIRGALNDNVHSLEARFRISYPDFIIREATAEITRMPYTGYCTGSVTVLEKFVGVAVGRGFRHRAGEITGGAASCNHLHTLVINMASCAFQMNYIAAKRKPEAEAAIRQTADDPARRRELVLGWMPQLRNSCFVFSEANDQLFKLSKKTDEESAANSE
jgi:hypothetical protein